MSSSSNTSEEASDNSDISEREQESEESYDNMEYPEFNEESTSSEDSEDKWGRALRHLKFEQNGVDERIKSLNHQKLVSDNANARISELSADDFEPSENLDWWRIGNRRRYEPFNSAERRVFRLMATKARGLVTKPKEHDHYNAKTIRISLGKVGVDAGELEEVFRAGVRPLELFVGAHSYAPHTHISSWFVRTLLEKRRAADLRRLERPPRKYFFFNNYIDGSLGAMWMIFAEQEPYDQRYPQPEGVAPRWVAALLRKHFYKSLNCVDHEFLYGVWSMWDLRAHKKTTKSVGQKFIASIEKNNLHAQLLDSLAVTIADIQADWDNSIPVLTAVETVVHSLPQELKAMLYRAPRWTDDLVELAKEKRDNYAVFEDSIHLWFQKNVQCGRLDIEKPQPEARHPKKRSKKAKRSPKD